MRWINVLWQDPDEGVLYDCWIVSGDILDEKGNIKQSARRENDCRFIDGQWFSRHGFADIYGNKSWLQVSGKVTHFMPSPEPPKD